MRDGGRERERELAGSPGSSKELKEGEGDDLRQETELGHLILWQWLTQAGGCKVDLCLSQDLPSLEPRVVIVGRHRAGPANC